MLPNDLAKYMEWFTNDQSREHLAQPGMVYITFPTEFGTIYSKSEIEEIYNICKRFDLMLFIDGARLGYGLMVGYRRNAAVACTTLRRLLHRWHKSWRTMRRGGSFSSWQCSKALFHHYQTSRRTVGKGSHNRSSVRRALYQQSLSHYRSARYQNGDEIKKDFPRQRLPNVHRFAF